MWLVLIIAFVLFTRLEISLEKVEDGMWPSVLVGDTRGELVMTPEQLEAIHERLAHLTSEDWVSGKIRSLRSVI